MKLIKLGISILCLFTISCTETSSTDLTDTDTDEVREYFESLYPSFYAQFSETLNFSNILSYTSEENIPNYITQDNTANNEIVNSGSLLGRILFYDTNLSSDMSISCSSCHVQEHAFSDIEDVSEGVDGLTARHSMRLINSRFSNEEQFFWDERADTLEEQTTQPIQDHVEMGFSGEDGDPDFDDLINRLSAIDYYTDLFTYAYGSSEITETKIQLALAQFIRSIQSFDSEYDAGRSQVVNDNVNFPNYSADQNAGKQLFLAAPNAGGAGCAACHTPPEFSIDPQSRNNGSIGVFGSFDTDLTVTRAPSLRDLVKPDGSTNGAFMHDASLQTLEDVVDFYDDNIVDNANLDQRLQQGGAAQNLGLNATEKAQLVEFLKTLSGTDVYTNEKWADPF